MDFWQQTCGSRPDVGMPDSNDLIDSSSGEDVGLGAVFEGVATFRNSDPSRFLGFALLATSSVLVVLLRRQTTTSKRHHTKKCLFASLIAEGEENNK